MNIVHVEAQFVDGHWPEVGPLLQKALDESNGETDLEMLRGRLADGRSVLLVAEDDGGEIHAAFVVSRIDYDNFSSLRVAFAGGYSMDRWLAPLVEHLEAACERLGCQQLEIFGRPGFARALCHWADHTYTVMVRKVPDGRKRHADHHLREHAGALGPGSESHQGERAAAGAAVGRDGAGLPGSELHRTH